MKLNLYNGDFLKEIGRVPDGCVDFVLNDPPYGTTDLKWDEVIDFKKMWTEIRRVLKPNGVAALFGIEPFSTRLKMSNINNYSYDIYWKKERTVNFLHMHRQPGKVIETISFFYRKPSSVYNHGLRDVPIPSAGKGGFKPGALYRSDFKHVSGREKRRRKEIRGGKFPINLVHFKMDKEKHHPTQKPVKLLEYLIKTYSNPGDMVLDFTMGSGSTGVAAVRTGRRFTGIELNDDYFKIAKKRIEQA